MAMGRAFPLLLDKPIQRAKAAAAACDEGSKDGGSECAFWAEEVRGSACCPNIVRPCLPMTLIIHGQAVIYGLAGPFLSKLGSQPQITSAYDQSASIIRDKALLQEAAHLFQMMKVIQLI